MKLKEIYDFLDNLSPFALQEKWDNAGLLVGSFDDEIKNIYLNVFYQCLYEIKDIFFLINSLNNFVLYVL